MPVPREFTKNMPAPREFAKNMPAPKEFVIKHKYIRIINIIMYILKSLKSLCINESFCLILHVYNSWYKVPHLVYALFVPL